MIDDPPSKRKEILLFLRPDALFLVDLEPLVRVSFELRPLKHWVTCIEAVELNFCFSAATMQCALARLFMLQQYLSPLRRAVCVCLLQCLTFRGSGTAQWDARGNRVGIWANLDWSCIGACSQQQRDAGQCDRLCEHGFFLFESLDSAPIFEISALALTERVHACHVIVALS